MSSESQSVVTPKIILRRLRLQKSINQDGLLFGKCPYGRAGIQRLGNSEPTNSGATKPVPFQKTSGQMMQNWQKLLMRNSGRFAVISWRTFPGASTSTVVCIPH